MQVTDKDGNVFGNNGLEVTGPDGKPKTTGGGSVTPAALTKVDDTNVTLTLGGSPSVALLQATSLTLGWTGTLADSRIASAATWNAKQNAITLTTTGTSGPATLVGSTLNIPQYSGGGGLRGIHSILPLASGNATTFTISSPTWSGTNFIASRLVLVPYIPAQTINSNALQYFVNINVAGSLCRLLIYSDLNGKPDTKLYESANIDCSTTGLKTVLNSFTFNVGTTYWLAFHGGATVSGTVNVSAAGMMPIMTSASSTPQTFTFYYVNVALGSAPATISSTILSGGNVPYIGIRVA
jgi:hypothetical protein